MSPPLCLLSPPSRSSPLHPSLVWGSKVRSVEQFNVGSLPEEVPVVNFIQQEAAIKCRRARKIPSHDSKRSARPPGCGRQNCWGAMCSLLRFVRVCTRPSASGIHRFITIFRWGPGPSVWKNARQGHTLGRGGQGSISPHWRGVLNPIWTVSSPRFRQRVHERRYLNEYSDVMVAVLHILPRECDDDAPAKA